MYNFKNIFVLVFLSLSIFSCSTNNSEQNIVDPVGSAHYFVKNQSSKNLTIALTTKESGADSSKFISIPRNVTTKVYEDNGVIGVNPSPSYTFEKIKFFKHKNNEEATLIIFPVTNEKWKITSSNLKQTDYGLRTYELTITDKDLSN